MNQVDTKNAVFIIDGSSFLYRAYYSIRPLTAPNGKPVQAVFGFCRMIKKIIDTYNPHFIVVAWDSKGKTVRHEIYEAYKATRQAAPSDLTEQKELIQKFAQLVGLTQIQTVGVEADDLMYSLAKELEKENAKSIFVTSDKDMGQAISENIMLLDPFKEAFISKSELEAKFEFPIEKLPFYYAIVGDSSDNIPGVKGIGPKGAQDLAKQFSSLEDLYNNLEKVSSERIRNLLTVSKENALLSQKLFLLQYYPLNMNQSRCEFNKDNWDNAKEFFLELNFKSLVKDKEPEKKEERPPLSERSKYNFIMVNTQTQLNTLCQEIKTHKRCALDTEGTSLSPLQGTMVGLSFCVHEGTSYYIPFAHQTDEQQLSREVVLGALKPLLEDPSIEKYLHHAKFDALMLFNEGVDMKGITFDTMIAASLLIGEGQRIGLKYLSEYYLNEPMLMFNEVVKEKGYKNFSYVPIELATEYAAADSHQTMRLYNIFNKDLHEKQLADFFHKIEMPLLPILYDMEKEGIEVDVNILKNLDEIVSKELSALRNEIIDVIGLQFAGINLNSPKQLEELLFVHLKLPVLKKTAGRTSYSTDQEVLKDLSKLHPVPALIMRYRELFKLKTTYLEALQEYVNPKTKKIHTTFSQTQVATGRLASSEPNLQNIPVDRYHIRSSFKAPEGHVFLSADYSQIELRVLAYLSQDETLVKAFNEGQDIHALTAAGLFDVPLDQVTHEQRQLGKRINFSILYGLTPHGLSKDLDISHSLAKNYIDKYMANYKGVSTWMERVIEETKEKGYVTTHWGRKRYLAGIHERNRTLYELAKRIAINTKAQGTAAELVKLSMINLSSKLKDQNLNAKMILQIHDELLLQVPVSELETVQKLVINTLENATQWNIPLVVTTRTGSNWQEVTK